MNHELRKKVFDLVFQIPVGKVATYGQIAKLAGTGPRVVGNILHQNSNPDQIPCHRVVNHKGRVASSYAFGGPLSQKKKLEGEGIVFQNEKIDLNTYMIDCI